MRYGLDITTTNAQLNINTHMRGFRVKRTPPRMEITNRAPSFKVNWDKVRSQSGLKNPKYLMESNVQKAQSTILNGISRIASEGDMMTQVGQNQFPTDMVSTIALQNQRAAMPEFNMVPMPKDLAEITWDKGVFEINWTKGSLEVMWDEKYMPDISVTPYSVEINIRDLGEVKVKDNGKNVEGRKVDKKI